MKLVCFRIKLRTTHPTSLIYNNMEDLNQTNELDDIQKKILKRMDMQALAISILIAFVILLLLIIIFLISYTK